MKLLVKKSADYKETEIIIKCEKVDDRLDNIIQYIRQNTFSITGVKDGHTKIIPTDDVFYFDSTDERTFIYLESDVYDPASERRLAVLLRRDQHRQFLHELRQTEAGAQRMELLQVRRDQYRQLLHELRRSQVGAHSGLSLQQVRLAARRSPQSPEILPAVRRYFRRKRRAVISLNQ